MRDGWYFRRIRATRAIPELKPGPRLVLLIAVTHMHKDTGEATMSAPTLAAETGMHLKTVRRLLADLRDADLLHRIKRSPCPAYTAGPVLRTAECPPHGGTADWGTSNCGTSQDPEGVPQIEVDGVPHDEAPKDHRKAHEEGSDPPNPPQGDEWTNKIRSHLPDKPTLDTVTAEVETQIAQAPTLLRDSTPEQVNEWTEERLAYRLQEWRDHMESALGRDPEAWAAHLIGRKRNRGSALPMITAALRQLRADHQQAQEGP